MNIEPELIAVQYRDGDLLNLMVRRVVDRSPVKRDMRNFGNESRKCHT
ncbi:MAG: hypothetical protein OXN84_20660 [Albidovulum sp.]|nr:hypothetical protein [Albidovulum sp.]